MNAKGRRYIFLLLFSIAVRLFFYFFPFENTFFEHIAKAHIEYDVIFYSVMISLLELLKDRKWLIGLTWINMIVVIAFSMLGWIRHAYSPFTQFQYDRFITGIGFLLTAFYVCIFFARRSPARLFFRCMPAVTILPYVYGAIAIIFHFPDRDDWLGSPTTETVIAILLNLLLVFATLRTPALRKPQYDDFME